MKKLKLYTKRITYLLAIWFSIHTSCIVIDGLTDEQGQSKFGVVFGNTVNSDGTLSPRLQARLDKAISLYFNHQIEKIFVSGGIGKEQQKEGTKMAEYLLNNGIPKRKITIDNKGNTTYLTALNFKEKFPHAKSITIISQYFHISRAKLIFRKLGFEKVKGAHCNYYELRDAWAIMREFFGYYSYLFK